MLKLENVTLDIETKNIIHGISASAKGGEFIIIVGQNGAGKSSLLELIAGTLKPSTGTIELNDKNITTLALAERAQYIGRLYQQPVRGSVGPMTVRENCALSLYKVKKVGLANGLSSLKYTQICNTIANTFNKSILDIPMASLSGGQRQLISFIMATAQNNLQLLLLDEPTAALDFQATDKMLKHIQDAITQKNVITIMVTHDFDIATSVGTRLWVINKGKLTHDIVNGQHRKLTSCELKKLMVK